jgi:HEAT repeat protein
MRGRRRGTALGILLSLALFAAPAGGNGWEHGAIPFDALLRALEFEQPETRRRAAESLGFRGQREAVEPLLRRVDRPEPDPHVRSAIYLALGRLGDARAVPVLSRCLDTESREELRSDCVTALGLARDARAVPRLLRALGQDASILVRARVVDALGSFAEPPAVAALAALVTGEQTPHLRLRAIRALGRTRATAAGEPLLAALGAARDDAERAVVVSALADVGPRDATRPLTTLLATAADPELRARIVIALGAIRDGNAVPALVGLLGDDVPAIRYFALESLRELGRPEAAGPIARLSLELSRRLGTRPLGDLLADIGRVRADLSVQEVAVRSLSDLDATQGLEALLAAAQPRDIPRDSAEALALAEALFEVRRTALAGLGYTRSRKAATVLAGRAGLGDPDFRLRATAARSVGVLGFADLAGRVTAALGDPAAEVRWTAAIVLGRLGQRAAVEPLLRRVSDRDPEVRRQAALSLGYLGDRRAAGRLRALARDDDHGGVREAAAYASRLLAR